MARDDDEQVDGPTMTSEADDTADAPTVVLPSLGEPEPEGIGRFADYVLLDRLGVGGMAEVFLARSTTSQDAPVVVLKLPLSANATRERYQKLFRREAMIATGLTHANIIRTFGLVDEGARLGLVMEHLEGGTLKDLARRVWSAGLPLPIEPVVQVVIDAARALEHLHGLTDDNGAPRGLVHRDVSPDNLFLTDKGVLKLMDFGIARSDDMEDMTRTGQLRGKAAFMAPEQIEGQKGLDGSADVYSLGVSFFWLLTGAGPFRADSVQALLRAVLDGSPARAREKNPDVPAAIEALLDDMLRRERGKRPTAAAVAARLAELMRPVPPALRSAARLVSLRADLEGAAERKPPDRRAVPVSPWPNDDDDDELSPKTMPLTQRLPGSSDLTTEGERSAVEDEIDAAARAFAVQEHTLPAPLLVVADAPTAPLPALPYPVDDEPPPAGALSSTWAPLVLGAIVAMLAIALIIAIAVMLSGG